MRIGQFEHEKGLSLLETENFKSEIAILTSRIGSFEEDSR